MNNMIYYNATRSVPEEAKKEIKGGRLRGMIDINPMWRIKTLTEQFGPVGVGWYYDIKSKIIQDGANGEKAAFVDIDLYVKINDEWSKPIQGTGGSSFVAKERGGLYTSDECFKMALTDAISVSCKVLGIGADVYYEKDKTKYTNDTIADTTAKQNLKKKDSVTAGEQERLTAGIKMIGGLVDELIKEKADKKDIANIIKEHFKTKKGNKSSNFNAIKDLKTATNVYNALKTFKEKIQKESAAKDE